MSAGPIQLQNRKLAEAMITAGLPFAPTSQEKCSPCLNTYTPGMLRDRGHIQGGIEAKAFEVKVLELAGKGITGQPTFFFERTGNAESFVKAWDDTASPL